MASSYSLTRGEPSRRRLRMVLRDGSPLDRFGLAFLFLFSDVELPLFQGEDGEANRRV